MPSPVSAHFGLSPGRNYTTRIYSLAEHPYSRKVAVWGQGEDSMCKEALTALHLVSLFADTVSRLELVIFCELVGGELTPKLCRE